MWAGHVPNMPQKRNNGNFAPLASTLKRLPKKAKDSYERTLESAEKSYGDEASAHRTAWRIGAPIEGGRKANLE
jgi:hypothetical protein